MLNRAICILCIALLHFAFWQSALAHESQTYTVTKVIDGDTLDASDGNITFRVRLAAIDAPEHDQPFGKRAKLILEKLVLNKTVVINPLDQSRDKFNRVLGIIKIGNVDIGLSLIEHGLAQYYRPTCKDWPADEKFYNYDVKIYYSAEASAKAEKLGMWSQKEFIPPCIWRHQNKKSRNHHFKKRTP